MLLDAQSLFSDNQEITTGTIASQNVVKFGKGEVSFVPVIIQSVSDFSNLSTLKAIVQTSENEDFSNPIDLIESTLTKEELKAGNKFPICHLPKGNKGYMRISYIATGESETTGKITAGVVVNNDLSY